MNSEDLTWDEAYSLLTRGEDISDATEITAAITRLAKPFDEDRIRRAAPLVARYLSHPDFLARYQAIWFLGCWGRVREYLPAIIRAAQMDEELDNRAFAARCAGQILKTTPDASAVRSLLQMVLSKAEDPDVRTAAYYALLYAFYGENAEARATDFQPIGRKSVEGFDMPWLLSLETWADQLPT